MAFRVHAHGGLANRLRVVLSYLHVKGAPLEVVWWPDSQVAGGRFADVFEPLRGVRFLDAGDAEESSCHPSPEAWARQDWLLRYRDLRLVAAHREAAEGWARFAPTKDYVAIHVRRTDHVALAEKLGERTPDEDFFAWCRRTPALQPVYLATDNGTTQAHFLRALRELGKRPFAWSVLEPHDRENLHDHRNTTLAEAAIDLYACARARDFLGTRASSFTHTIEILRRIGGWWTP